MIRLRQSPLSEQQVHSLPGMGYWSSQLSSHRPESVALAKRLSETEVGSHISPIPPDLQKILVSYMDEAFVGIQWRGMSACRLCGTVLGSCCMVTPDLKWRFPQAWQHYIIGHSVRPFPEQFIEDAKEWHDARWMTTRSKSE